jgi:hypothetical protein
LAKKIAADYQLDLVSTTHPSAPNVERIEKYLKHHLFQLQNPTPDVRLAFKILHTRSYDVLPSCLKGFDAKEAFERTLHTCRQHMIRLALQLLKIGFAEEFDGESGVVSFSSKLIHLKFGVHLYNGDPPLVFWVLTDFEVPDAPSLDPELKTEMVGIAANCVAAILLSGKDYLVALLQRYLLYFVTVVLRHLFILEFLKKLRKTKQFDRFYRILELKTADEDTVVSIVLTGFPGLTQTKFSFDLPDFFRLENLVEEKMSLLTTQHVAAESIFELDLTANRRLVGLGPGFWEGIRGGEFREVTGEEDLDLFKTFKVAFDISDPEKLMAQLRQLFLLEIYGNVASGLAEKGMLEEVEVKVFAWRCAGAGQDAIHQNGKRGTVETILWQSLGEGTRESAFRMVLEARTVVALVTVDEKGLTEDWEMKGRVRCFERVEGELRGVSHPLKDKLTEAIKKLA